MVEAPPDLPPDDQSVAAKTLDYKTLKPPETRLGASWAIRDRIAEMSRNDVNRSRKRAKMQNWVDGARPFSQRKMDRLGQGDRTNFNPREAEGMLDTAKTPYYGLVFRNPQFAVIESNFGNNPQLRSQWGGAISKSYHQALSDWTGFDYHMQLKQSQMTFYGVGIALFPDAENWQWESCKIGNFLVPDDAPALIDLLPEASYFRTINPVDLFKLADAKGAEENGWFPTAVKAHIIKKAPERLKQEPHYGETWGEEWVASLRRGDLHWNADSSQIRLAGYLLKEFDGTISHAILVDDAQPPDSRNSDTDDALLLFKKVGCFESFDQVVQPFFFDIGTGEWTSIKGLGPKITDNTQASARLICGMIDGARKGSALLMQAQDGQSEQISQLIEIGGANIIPAGLSLQQNRLAESLQGPMAVRRELQNINQSNVGQYTQRVSMDNQEPTLGQAQLNARQDQQLTEAATDRYCKSLDRLHFETARRIALMGIPIYKRTHPDETEPPDDFKIPAKVEKMSASEQGAYWYVRRIVEAGVPIDAVDPKWYASVKASRGVGSGSPAAMDVATSQGLGLIPMLDERGRNFVLRLRAAFLFGEQNVDSIVTPLEQKQMPDDQAAMAVLENNALRAKNGETLVTPTQNHATHFPYHLNDLGGHFQQLQQSQADPQEVLMHAQQAIPHMQQHLQGMAGDPSRKEHLKQMTLQLVQVSRLADQLTQQVKAAMQARQRNIRPQLDPDLIAGLAKVRSDHQIKQAKMQGDLALKAQKQQGQMHLADIRQAHDMQLKNVAASNGAG